MIFEKNFNLKKGKIPPFLTGIEENCKCLLYKELQAFQNIEGKEMMSLRGKIREIEENGVLNPYVIKSYNPQSKEN